MRRLCILLAAIFLIAFPGLYGQAPLIEWQKTFGGKEGEGARCVRPTKDGGYIVAGYSGSWDGDVTAARGSYDFWILKLDGRGALQWQTSLGGSLMDEAFDIQQTSDGGYIIAGRSESVNGDVHDHHGQAYQYDFWVVKISSTGAKQWTRSYGGSMSDMAASVKQTPDGGYIVVGSAMSSDGDVTGHHNKNYGTFDYWVVKLSPVGAIEWQKCYGGSMNDQAYSVQLTPDGGYIINGAAQSEDGDMDADDHYSHNYDYWVIKISATGTLQWQRSLGGYNDDWGQYLQLTPDGGYILGGRTASNDGDVSGNHFGFNANFDYWVVKIDGTGQVQWQKCLGGTNFEDSWAVNPTADGGYIVAGSAFSSDGDVGGIRGYSDVWVVKLSAAGAVEWKKTMGSSDYDGALYIEQTPDNGFILAGAASAANGDVTQFKGGYGDVWVIKLKGAPCTPEIRIRASVTTVCAGEEVTFTSSVKNGGTAPFFQWKVNGIATGANNSTFSSRSLADGDTVTCVLTPDAVCAPQGDVLSDTIVIKVTPRVTPAIAIAASARSICAGRPVTFTATATHAGTAPAYRWFVNGVPAGAGQPTYSSSTLADGDVVSCKLLADPSFTCVTAPEALSNSIAVQVMGVVMPVVRLEASAAAICPGTEVTFTAAVSNAGTSPVYQWMVNSVKVGSNAASYTTPALKDGDKVFCIYTPGGGGCSALPVHSDTVAMVVYPNPGLILLPADTSITAGAQVKLRAATTGTVASYSWSPAGQLVQPATLQPQTVPLYDEQTFSLQLVNDFGCKAAAKAVIKVTYPFYMPTAFTPDGDGLNDVFRIPPGASLQLKDFTVFNRWGEAIFTTTDREKGWDGTFKGAKADLGVYVFLVRGTTDKGNVVVKGVVTLIR